MPVKYWEHTRALQGAVNLGVGQLCRTKNPGVSQENLLSQPAILHLLSPQCVLQWIHWTLSVTKKKLMTEAIKIITEQNKRIFFNIAKQLDKRHRMKAKNKRHEIIFLILSPTMNPQRDVPLYWEREATYKKTWSINIFQLLSNDKSIEP